MHVNVAIVIFHQWLFAWKSSILSVDWKVALAIKSSSCYEKLSVESQKGTINIWTKMFCWEPEGHYRCTMSMAMAPLWLSMEHHWIVIAPVWLSTDDINLLFNLLNMVWVWHKCTFSTGQLGLAPIRISDLAGYESYALTCSKFSRVYVCCKCYNHCYCTCIWN